MGFFVLLNPKQRRFHISQLSRAEARHLGARSARFDAFQLSVGLGVHPVQSAAYLRSKFLLFVFGHSRSRLLVSIEIVVHVGAASRFSDQIHYAAVAVALPIVRCTRVSAFALPINAAVRSMGGDTAVTESAIRSGCATLPKVVSSPVATALSTFCMAPGLHSSRGAPHWASASNDTTQSARGPGTRGGEEVGPTTSKTVRPEKPKGHAPCSEVEVIDEGSRTNESETSSAVKRMRDYAVIALGCKRAGPAAKNAWLGCPVEWTGFIWMKANIPRLALPSRLSSKRHCGNPWCAPV